MSHVSWKRIVHDDSARIAVDVDTSRRGDFCHLAGARAMAVV
jgi:hypothetical protein